MDNISNKQFCFSLPKIELHAHLNGSLSARILQILGCQHEDILFYQKSKRFPDERNLSEAFKRFEIAHKATTSPDSVYIATKNVIEEFFQENIIYLELRTTPRSEVGMTAETYLESVIKAIQEKSCPMMVKLILSLNRQHSVKLCEDNLDLILKMRSKYPNIIKGIDLSGNPFYKSFSDLKKLFIKAKESGLCTTIHCGEIENDEEVSDILEFKPDRLGHACFLHPDFNGCLKNWNSLKELKIPTEICLSSNIQTGTTDRYENHHVREWIRAKLPFSLNTDDKGVFDTSLSEELEYAMQFLNLSPEDLWLITVNSVNFCFANNEEKSFLKSQLLDWRTKNSHLF